ncbi:rhomboid family intramembrane serine protease [Costertonia aggregata]|uniref:Rhomboid family intramembrane serine protease n=1 Tax=Costertonia aggregata TaxID=343403 RepID=A0A7H9ARK6_9FLAO|nr:rhomboid family intramembrane serine protease [Costertonia aggregata]QLG46074.1 rhomboid family intramembrane serine protease [Costertonia aggregata]
MSNDNHFKFTNTVLIVPMSVVLLIWVVFWIEVTFKLNLNHFGVYPRSLSGIKGVFLSPFIHASLEHLYNNTIPIAILTASLVYFYKKDWIKVLTMGIVFSGFLTWSIARPSYHIGISGLIYVLVSFIFFKGIFTKYYRLVALSLFVVFIYGSLLWYIFPVKGNISWEGHLSGFITGLLLAVFIKSKIPDIKKYAWEKEDYKEGEDEFLKHFDEDGNFIETKSKDETDSLLISYDYKENSDKKD